MISSCRSTASARSGAYRHARRLWRRVSVVSLLLVLAFGLFAPPLWAQDESAGPVVRVETTSGKVLIGRLVSETESEIVIEARGLGRVTIQRSNVASLTEVEADRIRDGAYWFENPQSTRHFFAPNALGLPKGRGYYQNTWILLNNVNVGVTDHFSMGAGIVPIFLFGADAVPIWVLPKVSVSVPNTKLHLAAGAVAGGVLGEDGESVGILYGASTVGTRDDNATIGVGYGYADGGLSDTPAITISGMTRIGRTTYLISENYVFPGSEASGIVSLGVRWAPENFAVDFALIRPVTDADGLVGIPWLGVTIPFGDP